MEGEPRVEGLSLVLPAYNEEAGIRQAVLEAEEALARLVPNFEILVVDDGSRDETAAVVTAMARSRPHLRLLRHDANRGYGAALRTGFEAARFARVAFTDADCQFFLEDLGRLLPLSQRYPVAVGYREKRQDPWRRRFLSWGYNQLARALLGTRVRDCDCALKVFRREALQSLLPESRGYFVNTEILTRAAQQGHVVAEVGVRHRPRLRGTSKVSLGDVPRTLGVLLPFWWSQVLFPTAPPGEEKGRRGEGEKGKRGILALAPLCLLLVVAGLLFFGRLRAPLLEPQEPRYAEIPRQMLAEGSWLTPVLHGQPYLDKPPLLYWLVMASYALFGVHDWAARLVPGLAGLLTVLVTYLWGRRTAGAWPAFWGALILALSARFVYLERLLTMDCLLCLSVTAGLAGAHLALTGDTLHRGWWLLSATACGLGLLTKGPVALVLVLVPVLIYCCLESRRARVRFRDGLVYLAWALGLAAPWFVAVTLSEPDFALSFFWKHNVVRFLAPFDHEKPSWFHLPGLLLGMLPWTLLLPGLVRFLADRSWKIACRRPPALGFFLLAFLWALVFFSASGCKRPVYILPAMPPLALALGCYLATLKPTVSLRDLPALALPESALAYRATVLVLLAGLGVVGVAGFNHLLRPGACAALGGLTVAAIGFVSWRRTVVAWGSCAAVTFAVLFVGVYQVLPAYSRHFALRGHVRSDESLSDPGSLSIACYPQRWDSVSFYLPDASVRVYPADQRRQLLEDLRVRPQTLLFVKSGRVLQELLDDLPDSLEWVPRGRPGIAAVGWVRTRAEVPGRVARR